MSTINDPMLEQRLGALMRGVLDAENGPHQSWVDSPAARRIAAGEGKVSRFPRPPLRILALAAVLVVGGAVAAVGAARLLDTRRAPLPTLPVVALPSLLTPTASAPSSPGATPVPTPTARVAVSRNGWIAYSIPESSLRIQKPGDEPIPLLEVGSSNPCPQFGKDGLLAVADLPPQPNEFRWDVTTISLPEARTSPNMIFNIVDTLSLDERPSPELPCFEWSPDGTRVAYTTMLRNDGLFTIADENGRYSPFTVGRDNPPPVPDFVRWSPDGSQLAYVYSVDTREGVSGIYSRIRLVPADVHDPGRELDLGDDYPEVINDIAWSPDSDRIAIRGTKYTPRINGNEPTPYGAFVRMMTVLPDGVELLPVDDVNDPVSSLTAGPVWSPDGDDLAWVLDGELRVGFENPFGSVSSWRVLPAVSSDELGTGWATDPIIWSADGTQVLSGQLDAANFDSEASQSLVLYNVDHVSSEQPQTVLPWQPGGYGRITWQVLGE